MTDKNQDKYPFIPLYIIKNVAVNGIIASVQPELTFCFLVFRYSFHFQIANPKNYYLLFYHYIRYFKYKQIYGARLYYICQLKINLEVIARNRNKHKVLLSSIDA